MEAWAPLTEISLGNVAVKRSLSDFLITHASQMSFRLLDSFMFQKAIIFFHFLQMGAKKVKQQSNKKGLKMQENASARV